MNNKSPYYVGDILVGVIIILSTVFVSSALFFGRYTNGASNVSFDESLVNRYKEKTFIGNGVCEWDRVTGEKVGRMYQVTKSDGSSAKVLVCKTNVYVRKQNQENDPLDLVPNDYTTDYEFTIIELGETK